MQLFTLSRLQSAWFQIFQRCLTLHISTLLFAIGQLQPRPAIPYESTCFLTLLSTEGHSDQELGNIQLSDDDVGASVVVKAYRPTPCRPFWDIRLSVSLSRPWGSLLPSRRHLRLHLRLPSRIPPRLPLRRHLHLPLRSPSPSRLRFRLQPNPCPPLSLPLSASLLLTASPHLSSLSSLFISPPRLFSSSLLLDHAHPRISPCPARAAISLWRGVFWRTGLRSWKFFSIMQVRPLVQSPENRPSHHVCYYPYQQRYCPVKLEQFQEHKHDRAKAFRECRESRKIGTHWFLALSTAATMEWRARLPCPIPSARRGFPGEFAAPGPLL